MGEFRRQLLAQRGQEALNNLQAFTKWVPRNGKMTKPLVEKNIDIRGKPFTSLILNIN